MSDDVDVEALNGAPNARLSFLKYLLSFSHLIPEFQHPLSLSRILLMHLLDLHHFNLAQPQHNRTQWPNHYDPKSSKPQAERGDPTVIMPSPKLLESNDYQTS